MPDWPAHEARASRLASAPRTFASDGRGQFYGDVAAGRAWPDAMSAASADVAASLVMLLIRDTDPEELHFRDDLSWRLARAIGTGAWRMSPIARLRRVSMMRGFGPVRT